MFKKIPLNLIAISLLANNSSFAIKLNKSAGLLSDPNCDSAHYPECINGARTSGPRDLFDDSQEWEQTTAMRRGPVPAGMPLSKIPAPPPAV